MEVFFLELNKANISKLHKPMDHPEKSEQIKLPNSSATPAQLFALTNKYPFLKIAEIGKSVMGAPILAVCLGEGPRRVLYSASHHANEWISTLVLMRFISDLCQKIATNTIFCGKQPKKIIDCTTLCFVPLVNPDGVDIATGYLSNGIFYDKAKRISENYPDIPFPSGWKANICGIDLNLQYPAGWEKAKMLKEQAGFDSPAPRDYVGSFPLCAPESFALANLTSSFCPDTVIALHSQGKEIYWKYAGYAPIGSQDLGRKLAESSGYTLSPTPALSDNAGYKDWFIAKFDKPGYTVELGLGENPLPIEQFDEIYSDCMPMLLQAALV